MQNPPQPRMTPSASRIVKSRMPSESSNSVRRSIVPSRAKPLMSSNQARDCRSFSLCAGRGRPRASCGLLRDQCRAGRRTGLRGNEPRQDIPDSAAGRDPHRRPMPLRQGFARRLQLGLHAERGPRPVSIKWRSLRWHEPADEWLLSAPFNAGNVVRNHSSSPLFQAHAQATAILGRR